MMPTRSALRLVLLLGALLTGCAEPTTPARYVVSTFVLRSFDGRPLPTVTREDATQRFTLVADSVAFYSNGDYMEVSVTDIDVTQPPSATRFTGHREGSFAIRGDSIDFTIRCPPGALCILPPLAWRVADGFTTAYRATSGLAEVKHYQRVGFPPD